MSKVKKKVKTESQEQKALVMKLRWFHPEIEFFAIPNGGKRGKAEARHLVLEGLQKGTFDIFIAEPVDEFCGLFIELKRADGGKASQEQLMKLERYKRRGYAAEICHGAEEAYKVIRNYLFDLE